MKINQTNWKRRESLWKKINRKLTDINNYLLNKEI